MHRTVAQLSTFLAPLPEPAIRRPPKEKKEKAPNKRKAEVELDADGPPVSKRRKSKAVADVENGMEGLTAAGDTPSISTSKSPRKNREQNKPRRSNGVSANGENTVAKPANTVLNLPPGEATRRQVMAEGLLRDSGIAPDALSPEQLNIFANQSPELQRESLAMLVKYGPERLRIVHPSKNTSASASPSTPNSASQGGSEKRSSKTQSRKKKSDAEVADNSETGDATPVPAPPKLKKPRQTRGKCEGCKARKLQVSCKHNLRSGSFSDACQSVQRKDLVAQSVTRRVTLVITPHLSHRKGSPKTSQLLRWKTTMRSRRSRMTFRPLASRNISQPRISQLMIVVRRTRATFLGQQMIMASRLKPIK
jgi:hypothetical protein